MTTGGEVAIGVVVGALTGVGDGLGRDTCLLQFVVAEVREGKKEAGRIGGWGSPRSTLCLLWEDKPKDSLSPPLER